MRKIQVHILDECYYEKPDKNEIARISQKITSRKRKLNIEEFAREVGENGKPFTPAFFNGSRKKENFVQQEIYALDFDGGFTFQNFIEKSYKYEIIPAFVYNTYSSTEEDERFRAVYICDCVSTDQRAADIMIKLLLQIFPEADKNCSDVSRLFLGGKKIVYMNPKAEINIRDVVLNLQTWLCEKDKKNYGRNIIKLGNQLGIAVDKGLLCVHRLSELNKNEEIGANPYYIMGNARISSKCYIIEPPQHHVSIRPKENIKELRNKSCHDIAKICPLFGDFYDKDLPHEYKFLLATNLIHVKGGKTFFFDGLMEHREKWEFDWKYIKYYNYHPQRCQSGGCPYCSKCRCKSLYEKLARTILRIEEETYISLDEAEHLLPELISDALDKKDQGIHLITAQTALGKTTAYCRIVEQWQGEKPLMIAVPTTKLQKQVYDDLKYTVKDLVVTLNVKDLLNFLGMPGVLAEVEGLYDRGLGHRVKHLIRKSIEENKDILTKYQREYAKEYMELKKHLDGKHHVITTHAMLLALPESILNKYEILVDEDILMSVFKNTKSITFEELNMLLDTEVSYAVDGQRIKMIMNMEDMSVGKTGLSEPGTDLLDKLYEEGLAFRSSIADFLGSDTFYVDKKEEIIHYLKVRKFPDVKMTIVSATVNDKLYRDFCRNKYVDIQKVPYVKYRGELMQYTAYSMSRSCIQNIGMENIKETVNSIVGNADTNWISFKMLDRTKQIYFGKTEGFNDYKGKNLAVIGTPHNIPFVYYLIGEYLGYQIKDNLNVRTVQHNGYQFQIMTFEGTDMRNLQFYFIESELEQAIGRARLLRFNCKVYLFSNFPCRQADIIQDSYLEVSDNPGYGQEGAVSVHCA